MKKTLLHKIGMLTAMLSLMVLTCEAVTVNIMPQWGNRTIIFGKAESSVAELLTEINRTADNGSSHVTNKNLRMTQFAKRSLEEMWSKHRFRCLEECVNIYGWELSNCLMARNIPIEILSDEPDPFRWAVVEVDKNGIITDFRYQLSYHVASSAKELDESFEEVKDVENRAVILRALEQFRTAYDKKDLTTIENMFSDDALIITGYVTQRITGGDNKMMTPKVRLNRQNKQQYIDNLRRCFAKNSWIKVHFEGYDKFDNIIPEVMPVRSTKNPNIYGMKLKQTWKSSTYSDEGCLFLIWDFTDQERPVIHVRTWQPLKAKVKTSNGLEKEIELDLDDNITSLEGFRL
ncbi:MAG: hypothetical protein IJ199_06445 [Prevotella sp.]|nr:hypothetical protein [Prevotella sp.]